MPWPTYCSRVLLLHLLCGAAETRASFLGASAALLRGTGLTAEPVLPFNATADFSWANEPVNISVGQYVAMCLAIKDQHHDIREWLQHHHSLGVGRFYIYDTASRVPVLRRIQDFVAAGVVDYHYVAANAAELDRAGLHLQRLIYDACLARHGRAHRFMGFLDADEFIILMEPKASLPSLLQEYEDFGGLAMNWQLYGSSGHLRRQESALHAYSKCLPSDHPENRHVKTFANTHYTQRVGPDPHHFIYIEGMHAVNEQFDPVWSARTDTVSTKRVKINHYVVKSRQEFGEKLARGSPDGRSKVPAYWDLIEALATDDCPYNASRSKVVLA